MAKAETRVKIHEQEKLEAKMQGENFVVTEESGRTRKYTWGSPMLTEQREQRKNYVILRDRHQRDKKTGNKKRYRNKKSIKVTMMQKFLLDVQMTLREFCPDFLKSSQPSMLE